MTIYKGEKTAKDGHRVYIDKDDNEYISITTLLSKYEDKGGLHQWAARIGQEEADRIRDAAAERGKITHSQIEAFFDNKRASEPVKLEIGPHASAAISKFYGRVEPVREESVVMWEPEAEARLAGRFDQLLYLPENTFRYCDSHDFVLPGNVVVDLKTKDKQPRLDRVDYIVKHLMQISAYAKMLHGTEGWDIKGGCVVYAVALKTKNCCRVLHIDREAIDFYWEKVLSMLLDYYGLQPLKQTWKDIIREASYTYDFIGDHFVSFEPREIY